MQVTSTWKGHDLPYEFVNDVILSITDWKIIIIIIINNDNNSSNKNNNNLNKYLCLK